VNLPEKREEFNARAEGARSELIASISATFPDAVVNVGKEFASHILNISFPNRDTDYAVMLLSKAGYAVSTKSACETDETGSHVVFALTGDEVRATSTLRISWGPTTHVSDIKKFSKELTETIKFLDAHAL
jgi:cysteine sulfinate desulfinase/cysteine desulfurase-like protein